MGKQWFEEDDPIWEDNPFAVAAVIAGVIIVVAFIAAAVWSLL